MGQDPLIDLRFPQSRGASSACPICTHETGEWLSGPDLAIVPCPRCGTYQITGSALGMTDSLSPRQRLMLSGYSRDHLLNEKPAVVNSDTVRASAQWPKPSLKQRSKRMLRWAVARLEVSPNEHDQFDPSSPFLVSASYSSESIEALQIARILEEFDFAKSPPMGRGDASGLARYISRAWQVTARGRLAAEQDEAEGNLSTTGFGAMWFADDMKIAWNEAISPAISDAGYDPIRVDQIEHVGKIDDEILVQIRKSRFVVADFTGHRAGVYFESGFALG